MYLTSLNSFNMALDIKHSKFNTTMRVYYSSLENVHVIIVL